ncbi:hypothetical protein ACFBZI_11385 [Moraxella sp. ZJ142]|uniref:hypothetical protein n=1 Tax=Moraxella marmotae TaxID=3344520 RepID=UPI0035D40ACE
MVSLQSLLELFSQSESSESINLLNPDKSLVDAIANEWQDVSDDDSSLSPVITLLSHVRNAIDIDEGVNQDSLNTHDLSVLRLYQPLVIGAEHLLKAPLFSSKISSEVEGFFGLTTFLMPKFLSEKLRSWLQSYPPLQMGFDHRFCLTDAEYKLMRQERLIGKHAYFRTQTEYFEPAFVLGDLYSTVQSNQDFSNYQDPVKKNMIVANNLLHLLQNSESTLHRANLTVLKRLAHFRLKACVSFAQSVSGLSSNCLTMPNAHTFSYAQLRGASSCVLIKNAPTRIAATFVFIMAQLGYLPLPSAKEQVLAFINTHLQDKTDMLHIDKQIGYQLQFPIQQQTVLQSHQVVSGLFTKPTY